MSRRALVVGLLTLQIGVVGSAMGAQGPYPPPESSGRVEPSRIKIGDCATFSGEGFSAGTVVAVTDNDEPRGTAVADRQGGFRKELCYPSGSKPGRHHLEGTGDAAETTTPSAMSRISLAGRAAAAGKLTVTADLIVQGVQQSGTSTGAGSGKSGDGGSAGGSLDGSGSPSLARTGTAAVAAVVTALGLITAGSALLLGADRRHRRRRRLAA